jgi:hypothetical protein
MQSAYSYSDYSYYSDSTPSASTFLDDSKECIVDEDFKSIFTRMLNTELRDEALSYRRHLYLLETYPEYADAERKKEFMHNLERMLQLEIRQRQCRYDEPEDEDYFSDDSVQYSHGPKNELILD